MDILLGPSLDICGEEWERGQTLSLDVCPFRFCLQRLLPDTVVYSFLYFSVTRLVSQWSPVTTSRLRDIRPHSWKWKWGSLYFVTELVSLFVVLDWTHNFANSTEDTTSVYVPLPSSHFQLRSSIWSILIRCYEGQSLLPSDMVFQSSSPSFRKTCV